MSTKTQLVEAMIRFLPFPITFSIAIIGASCFLTYLTVSHVPEWAKSALFASGVVVVICFFFCISLLKRLAEVVKEEPLKHLSPASPPKS